MTPPLVNFVRDYYPDPDKDHPERWPEERRKKIVGCVHRDIPKDKDGKPVTMWSLIASHHLPPTRTVRYCCDHLKESSGQGRVTITGVRWVESPRRKETHGVADVDTKSKKIIGNAMNMTDAAKVTKSGRLILNDDNDGSRRIVEGCYRTRKTLVNPIVDWTDDDVWMFLNEVAKVPHCCLYDQGEKRLGCIGCPLAGRKQMMKDFEKYPAYKRMYINAMQKMIDNHRANGAAMQDVAIRDTYYTEKGETISAVELMRRFGV